MADALIAALAAYLPRDRAAQILAGAPMAAEGAALIADISGFTPLTEALARALSPARGAEELTRALNGVFAPLIAEVHARGGGVVKFGGDALIVWFPRPRGARRAAVLRRALGAGLAMQRVIARHGRVRTDAGEFTLAMKVGVAYGPALRTRLGDPALGYEDVIGGRTLDRMAEAEHHAAAGEVLVDPAGLPELGAVAELGEERDGLVVVRALRAAEGRLRGSGRPPAGDAGVEALRPYVPAEVFEAVRDGRPQPAELRPVVSIFVQFAGVSYEDGAEAEARLARYFAAAQAAAARYGGRVNRLITGDKGSVLHLIFGAPRALEDLERRAALCALELRRAAAALPFITAQRVGMTVGRAFAGPVGSAARRDYTVMGEAINRSARLMQRAEPGQIVVDAQLAERLAGGFGLAPLGAARLKGVAEPVELFDLLAEAAREAGPAPAPVGRGRELAALRGLLARLRAGRGGAAVLVGELGMGKSHLLAALRGEAGAGVAWASGGAAGYGPRPSGALLAAALRELLGLPEEPAAAAAALGPALDALLGPRRGAEAAPYTARLLGLPLAERQARELEALGGEGLRWRLTGLVRELAAAAAARRPVVLALDDVQWADPTSLDLLDALLPVAAGAPLLLILAARPGASGRAGALLARLPAEGAPALTLGPLDDAAAAELVRRHAPALGPADAARLAARGAGNPLFLVELARTVAAGAPLGELPDTVQGLVLAQVDRLQPAQREALQAASVLGAGATPLLVAEVLGGARAPALHELEALEAAGFLARHGEGYDFRHGLIRESAYAALLHERRRAWHGAAAAALERLYPARLADLAGTLALHHEGAGNLLGAARSHGQAADGARLLYAHEEAEAGYRRALELLAASAAPDDELRARTHLKLAQVKMNQGDYAAAQELYDVAFALLERADAVGQQGRRRAPLFHVGEVEPETLDPGVSVQVEGGSIIHELFEGLVAVDADLNIVPAAASSWRLDDAGLRYSFTLRPGLLWSDGAPLTAHDFVFAWRRNLAPSSGAGLATQLYPIRGAEAFHTSAGADEIGARALDDHTLEIELATPSAHFLYVLASPIAFPQPAHLVVRHGADWWRRGTMAGNGRFALAGWRPGRHLDLRRNRYARRRAGDLDAVRVFFGAPEEDLTRPERLDLLRCEDSPERADQHTGVTVTVQYLSTFMLAFACEGSPFASPELRRAFAQSVDRELLVAEVWRGVQQAARGGVVPPGMPGHSPEIGLPFDPPAARAALRRAGGLPHGLTVAALPGLDATAEFLRASWGEHLGAEVAIASGVPVDQLIDGLAGGAFQLAVLGWDLDFPEPADVLHTLFHGGSPHNVFGWRSDPFDRLVEEALALSPGEERLRRFHSADHLLVAEEIAAVPLYYRRSFALLRRGYALAEGARVVRGGRLGLDQIVRGG